MLTIPQFADACRGQKASDLFPFCQGGIPSPNIQKRSFPQWCFAVTEVTEVVIEGDCVPAFHSPLGEATTEILSSPLFGCFVEAAEGCISFIYD